MVIHLSSSRHKKALAGSQGLIIGFVGMQVRQNMPAAQVSNSQASLNAWTSVTLGIAADEGLAQIYSEDAYGYAAGKLGPDAGQIRLGMWATANLKAAEWNYLQWIEGKLPDDMWDGYRGSLLLQWTSQSIFARHWKVNQEMHSLPFRELVKEILPKKHEAGL